MIVTEKKHFQNNSFFKIIVMDSIASIILILNELFFNKLFTYITPLCPIVGPFFWRPSVILNIVYISLNHARFSKSVTQIFMVLNRMTCVLIPTEYDRIWRSLTPISCVLVVILPCGGMWNVWISRVFLQPYRGGFNIGYLKTVRWLSFAFCLSCDREIMYLLQALAFDLFTVGPAVIIVMTSKKIRESLFWWKEQSTKKISVISVSGLL
ncbi:hypothetical protein GCK72_006730 [Caenorhabditis remanei]|uniref:Serpentine receptor class gamma n=1 Tax=Caenorhabditis remanei TaxID=31234 RepID=A0A6A5HLM3_CAERE|nr:hypothetical protein GCK72_006730 [Caenorhabditis remanei]KAF1766772.1 hypothetical protein GCK72_006730 [Caenorhabditis remanei]